MLKDPIGECSYLGKKYPLYAIINPEVNKISIKFDNTFFLLTSPASGQIDISEALKSFYIKSAKKFIEKRLNIYQPFVKEKYKSFTIESNDKRWGSCSSNKKLTFHWKLMLFPVEAIDYVVIHELCHLKHLNHDRSFWRLVGKICPDYKAAMSIIGSEKSRDM